jgi:phosphomannomutase
MNGNSVAARRRITGLGLGLALDGDTDRMFVVNARHGPTPRTDLGFG